MGLWCNGNVDMSVNKVEFKKVKVQFSVLSLFFINLLNFVNTLYCFNLLLLLLAELGHYIIVQELGGYSWRYIIKGNYSLKPSDLSILLFLNQWLKVPVH